MPLQQSVQFARGLQAIGVPIVSQVPVVVARRFPVIGTVRFASRIGADALGTRPRVINAEDDTPTLYRAAGYHQIISPAHVALWDLSAPDRMARMSGKWRNQLRKGQNADLRIREVLWDGTDHWMFDLVDSVARKKRYRALPRRVLVAFAATNPKDALIFEAYAKGHAVAACLVLRHGSMATYQTAWSSTLGKHLNAARVLLDHIAQRLSELGHCTFDLGLVETDGFPGLARFKLGTGADLVRLGGTWVHVGRAPSGTCAVNDVTRVTRDEEQARHDRKHLETLRNQGPAPDGSTPHNCRRS